VLIFEQKDSTLLVKLVSSRRKSGLLQYRLSVPVIYLDNCAYNEGDLAIHAAPCMHVRTS
jgi:hypothetical protein